MDEVDINLLFEQMRSPNPDLSFDLTADGLVNDDDRDEMVHNVLATNYGDANLDLLFNSRDLVIVFQAGEYEDAILLNSLWETGDWNGDGDFNTSDLVLAFQSGSYESAAAQAASLQQIGAAFDHDGADLDLVSNAATQLASINRPLHRAVELELIEESLNSLFEDEQLASEKTVEQIAESLLETEFESFN